MRKKAQEEMVGFALIMIIVAVVLLMFLVFYLQKPASESIESYEVESFIQTHLQYTTDCRNNLEFRSIKDLIFDCYDNELCSNGRNTCEVLENELTEITQEVWKIENRPTGGYKLKILANEQEFIIISEGNQTGNSRGAAQYFSRGGNSFEIFFEVYD